MDNAATRNGPRLVTIEGGTVENELRIGANGSMVQALQQKLKRLGFDPGKVTGEYDSETEKAVKALQFKLGIAPTGVWTEDMDRLVNTDLASPQSKLKTTTALVLAPQNVSDTGGASQPLNKIAAVLKSPAFWVIAGLGALAYLSSPKVPVTVEGVEVDGDDFEPEEEEPKPKPKKPRRKNSKKVKAETVEEPAKPASSAAVVDVTPIKVEVTPAQ